MKTTTLVVKSGGDVVASPKCEVFESISEAAEFLGDEVALRMLNAQHAAEVGNKARAEATEWRREAAAEIVKAAARGDMEKVAEISAKLRGK